MRVNYLAKEKPLMGLEDRTDGL